MSQPVFESITAQVTNYLREQIRQGRWTDRMPGLSPLSSLLNVNRKTVESALRKLQNEGLIRSDGQGKTRRIMLKESEIKPSSLRVKILLYTKQDRQLDWAAEILHSLIEAGHMTEYASKTLMDLRMDVKRVSRFVQNEEADAWVVFSGSEEILAWFVQQNIAAFAMAGRRRTLPIAGIGPDKDPVMREIMAKLWKLGHRRIVMLCHRVNRLPQPGSMPRTFLQELEKYGIKPSDYNLPDWKESAEGYHARLETLFKITPPTALIVDEPNMFFAAMQFFSRFQFKVPEDVSLLCLDPHPGFIWFHPKVSHLSYDPGSWVRRITRWASNIALDKKDIGNISTRAVFIEGGTIGPVSR